MSPTGPLAAATEGAIRLGADGSDFDSRASSYSGSGSDSLGNPTMAWGQASRGSGQARWTISGSAHSASIHVAHTHGSATHISYRQLGAPGSLRFDGNTVGRESARCR